jgi:Amt family ammonium transporter
VNTSGAMVIGIFAAIVPYFAIAKLKAWFGYDDALDTFGVHGVGGTLGALMTGFLADERVNPVVGGLKNGLVMNQIYAVLVTLFISIFATAIIAFIVKALLGLRPSEDVETVGLDLAEHGEEGYTGSVGGSLHGHSGTPHKPVLAPVGQKQTA